MGSRGRWHPLALGPTHQSLAQGGTLNNFNLAAEAGKVPATGVPAPLVGECLLVTVPRPTTHFLLTQHPSLPDTYPPHQAFLSPAWGPDLAPWDQGSQQSKVLA